MYVQIMRNENHTRMLIEIDARSVNISTGVCLKI